MKIVVINYSELNECPDESVVINDIKRIYSNASSECKEEMGSFLNTQLSSLISNTFPDSLEIHFFDTTDIEKRKDIGHFVEKVNPDLLVSYNLAGFEMSTLADSLSYNTIACRQFHIIKKHGLPNEKYMKKLRSLNLFVFEDYS